MDASSRLAVGILFWVNGLDVHPSGVVDKAAVGQDCGEVKFLWS